MADRLAERREIAQRHVIKGRRVVERQREIVATHERCGLNSTDSRVLLEQFERTLAVFEEDLESILRQLDK